MQRLEPKKIPSIFENYCSPPKARRASSNLPDADDRQINAGDSQSDWLAPADYMEGVPEGET